MFLYLYIYQGFSYILRLVCSMQNKIHTTACESRLLWNLAALVGLRSWPVQFKRCHEPLTRYAKLWVVHALGMPGTLSPPPSAKETASQRSRHASRHVRDARTVMNAGIANPRWRRQRSRHFRRMRNPQFCVSGEWPIPLLMDGPWLNDWQNKSDHTIFSGCEEIRQADCHGYLGTIIYMHRVKDTNDCQNIWKSTTWDLGLGSSLNVLLVFHDSRFQWCFLTLNRILHLNFEGNF